MADPTTEDRLARLEAEQAAARRDRDDHAAWFRRMEALTAEVWQLHRETQAEMRETQAEIRETARRQHETDQQLRETDRILRESREETDRQLRETDRQLRDLRKEMGALGQKFVGFAEGMALPSMQRQLAERFGTTGFSPSLRKRLDGREIELDALAYADGDAGVAYVVEVKSRLREDGIDQLLRTLEAFPRFFPEHGGKKLIGVLTTVEAPPDLRQRVLREGLVLATISDDVFELRVPEGFEPRAFPNP